MRAAASAKTCGTKISSKGFRRYVRTTTIYTCSELCQNSCTRAHVRKLVSSPQKSLENLPCFGRWPYRHGNFEPPKLWPFPVDKQSVSTVPTVEYTIHASRNKGYLNAVNFRDGLPCVVIPSARDSNHSTADKQPTPRQA